MGTPIIAPEAFFAGDTVSWLVQLADYLPADGWSLRADITDATTNANTTSTDNGDGRHLITFAAADTANIPAGDYSLVVAAIKGTERHTVQSGQIKVRPDLTAAGDGRSHVKKTLDALEAWIEGRNPGVASYNIAGRQMQYIGEADLIALHDRYRRLYRRECEAARLASGEKPRRRIMTRMQG